MSHDQVISVLEKFSELKQKESTQNRATYYLPNRFFREEMITTSEAEWK
jgi:hypothetical protein